MDSVVENWIATLSDEAKKQFEVYYTKLIEWNEKINLTAITDRDEVYLKHFWDSAQIARLSEWSATRQTGRVMDVGTGAGFPGIPLAILQPGTSFVLLDSLQKRLRFLDEVVELTGLNNVTLVHGRAEALGRVPGYRHGFDVVVSRAVARLNVLLELTTPFLQPGGLFVAYKGPSVQDELEEAKRAAKRLNAEIVRVETFALPGGYGDRSMVVVRQRMAVPTAYPRKAGTPQKSPLS